MADPKLIDKLHDRLPPAGRKLWAFVLSKARHERLSLYLVGGPVRDLLLDRPSLDLDLVVEGDAIALARRLAETTVARLRTHAAFGTASLRLDGFVLDLTTARSETYAHAGALPTVTPASIREDLLRRDFTINAMAIPLTNDKQSIIDPAGGQADLKRGHIRVLHERSFQDDPTRIPRAFRYAARFGFTIEDETLTRLKRDLQYLDTISGARIHQELSRTLAEETPEATLLALDRHGVLTAIHPDLRFRRPQADAFTQLRSFNSKTAAAAYWPVLAWGVAPLAMSSLSTRLALTNLQRAALEAMAGLDALQLDLDRRSLKRSAVVATLSSFPLPTVYASAALTAGHNARERLLDYLTTTRHVRPLLRGDDLIALGVPAGPDVGETLHVLRDAKLNGEVHTRADEERLLHKLTSSSPK